MNFKNFNDFIRNLEPAATEFQNAIDESCSLTGKKGSDAAAAAMLGIYRFLISKTPKADPEMRHDLFLHLAKYAAMCAEEELKTGQKLSACIIPPVAGPIL